MELEYFVDPSKKEDCPYIDEGILNFELMVYSAEMQEKGLEPQKMSVKKALDKNVILLPWHAYWLVSELNWFFSLGANPDNFRVRQHLSDERSHYSTDTWDIEYKFPFGWKELVGIADRGTFDLEQHEKFSKKDLKIMDDKTGNKILPMVVAEPSLGVERAFLVFMFDAYSVGPKGNVILKLSPHLAPVKVAILPLVRKERKLTEMAREIYDSLKGEWNVVYDESASVGRRYARNDEMGTPFCVTIDNDSEKGQDVTVRNRDDGKQIRVKISDLKSVLRELISGEKRFEDL